MAGSPCGEVWGTMTASAREAAGEGEHGGKTKGALFFPRTSWDGGQTAGTVGARLWVHSLLGASPAVSWLVSASDVVTDP